METALETFNDANFLSTMKRLCVLFCVFNQRPPTPWRSILTSPAVWALAVAHIAHNWGYHTLFTTLPQYLSDVLKFSVAAVSENQRSVVEKDFSENSHLGRCRATYVSIFSQSGHLWRRRIAGQNVICFQNGVITAIPYLVRWISENVAGWVADKVRAKRTLRTNTARKLFNTLGEHFLRVISENCRQLTSPKLKPLLVQNKK